MIYLPLPWLTERLGGPAFVAIEPFVGLHRDEEHVPDGAFVLETTVPEARILGLMPARLPDPGQDPAAEDAVAWERFLDLFVVECVSVDGERLTEAKVQMLGPDRSTVVLGCLKVWGWRAEEDGTYPFLPSPAFLASLATMAEHCPGRLPSEFLRMPMHEFALNAKVLSRATSKQPGDGDPRSMLRPEEIES